MKNKFNSLLSYFDNLNFNYKTAFLVFIIAGGMICIIILSQISIFTMKQDFDILFDKRTKSLMQLENIKDSYKVNIQDSLMDFEKKQINYPQTIEVLTLAQEIIDKNWSLYQDQSQFENKELLTTFIKTFIIKEENYYENNTLEETIQLFSGKFVILTLLSIVFSSLIGIIASIFVSKQLSKPIYKLNENAKLMLQGNYSDVNIVSTKITEIDELSNSIVELSDSISNQENIRKEMVQNLAHDIRTPLTVLKTHFEAVLDGVIELDERNIKILNSEIDRLMNLIKKLDNLTEITRNPSTNELNISMETESIIELFWIDAKKNDITIIQNIEPNLQLIAEKSDYYQLLQNLINNAIKYNNKNGNIYVNLYKSKENIILEIKDTGIGIDQNKLKYIFERFYRNDTSRSREVQGNGLGLAIVKELIQRMNATISVESKINEGTQFTICFNLLSNKSI